MAEGTVVYRIEVGSREALDTVVDVITPLPVRVQGGDIVGLRLGRLPDNDAERQLFRYAPSSRKLSTRGLPDDVMWNFHDIAISPDGHYIAYVAQDSTGSYAVIREFASGRLVVRGPGGGGCDCDVDPNHARWFPPDSFEVAVTHAANQAGWVRVAGRASSRSIAVDTLDQEPQWH